MSNFFAALDDSGDEGKARAPPVATKKKENKKPEVVEPSKVETRPNKHDNRHTKGGRSSRPPAREGKRTFDRRSGTGRGREISKGGGGGHNWGSDKNDAKKAEGPVTEGEEEAAAVVVTAEENGADATDNDKEEEDAAAAVEEVKEPEPEDKTLSYEEYLAIKSRPDSAAFKPLEERTVENEFAGKSVTRKETEDFLVMGGGKQPKKKGQKKEEKKEKLILDFKVKSAISEDRGPRRDGRRDGEGRGGGGRDGRRDGRRDRGRGGGGGRSGRGGGGRGLDASDPNAFPSLN
eukprot:CCRYP_010631-RA/>CCRYP_010631-RA protein AED:0.05 eAED:0.05 QI:4427/1/1/1/0.66/0.5/4/256/290